MHKGISSAGGKQTCHHTYGRRLARAVGTEEPVKHPRRHLKTQAVDSHNLAKATRDLSQLHCHGLPVCRFGSISIL